MKPTQRSINRMGVNIFSPPSHRMGQTARVCIGTERMPVTGKQVPWYLQHCRVRTVAPHAPHGLEINKYKDEGESRICRGPCRQVRHMDEGSGTRTLCFVVSSQHTARSSHHQEPAACQAAPRHRRESVLAASHHAMSEPNPHPNRRPRQTCRNSTGNSPRLQHSTAQHSTPNAPSSDLSRSRCPMHGLYLQPPVAPPLSNPPTFNGLRDVLTPKS
jgi:hypothetical protein